MKLFALLLLKFVCLSVGSNPEVEEAFDPDSGTVQNFQNEITSSLSIRKNW